jgi:hypothetical protein
MYKNVMAQISGCFSTDNVTDFMLLPAVFRTGARLKSAADIFSNLYARLQYMYRFKNLPGKSINLHGSGLDA